MTKLNTAQRDLLTRAAATEDGTIDAADVAKPTATALIRRGMLISIPQAEGASRLLITGAGREAISMQESAAPSPTVMTDVAVVSPAPKGKIGSVIEMLRDPAGATIDAMMQATGWQAHSVRGALSGAIKKDRGLTVISDITPAGRVYRIVEGAGA
jgi:hypothetical protein